MNQEKEKKEYIKPEIEAVAYQQQVCLLSESNEDDYNNGGVN